MIEGLRIEHFKGRSGSFRFGAHTLLTGPNESGKTSVAEAIVFGYWGTTLTGSPQTDALVTKGSKGCVVEIATDAGTVITRRKTRAGQEITVNGNPCKQQDLDALLAEKGVTFDVFMGSFWPGYLMGLEERRRRSLLLSLLPRIDRVKALDDLTRKPGLATTYSLDLSDLDRAAKTVSQRLTGTDRQIAQLDGQIEGINRAAKARDTAAAPTFSVETLRRTLDEAESKCCELERVADLWEKRERLAAAAREAQDWNATVRERYPVVRAELDSVRRGTCPTCGGKIIGKGAKVDQAVIDRKVRSLEHELDGLVEREPLAIPEQPAQRWPTPDEIAEARGAVNRARQALAEAEAREQAAAAVQGDLDEMVRVRDGLLEQLRDLEMIVEALTPNGIAQREIEAGMEALKAASAGLEIVTTETLKSGAVKDCFRLAVDGIDYWMLSTGARKKCDLRVCRMIQRLSNNAVPVIFVDDADLLDCDVSELPDGLQVFVCRVAAEGELMVTAAEGPQEAAA